MRLSETVEAALAKSGLSEEELSRALDVSVNEISPLCQSLANPTVATATAAALGVLTPMPCMPVIPTPWLPGSSTVLIHNFPALLKEKQIKRRKNNMNHHDFANMPEEERHKTLLEMSDEDIDYSDIPELDEEFFKNAQRIEQKLKSEVNNISIRSDILEWFKTHAREKNMRISSMMF